MQSSRSFLRIVGSLWFAALLLVLLLVAMACATVFESQQGSERALDEFYLSWWFKGLLSLVAVNVLASAMVRFPWSKRQAGFLMTHSAILLILGGALVTQEWGLDGQLGLQEGQSLDSVSLREDALTLVNGTTNEKGEMDLPDKPFGGFKAADSPGASPLVLGETRVEILRYLPDSEMTSRVVDDNPNPVAAVQVSLSPTGVDNPVWVFQGRNTSASGQRIAFRVLATDAELARLVSVQDAAREQGGQRVRVDVRGESFDFALAECLEEPVPLGDTGFALRVLRYLPHATVGSDSKLTNVSDNPVNPAIEAHIIGPDGPERHVAFSRFPDFQSMHGGKGTEGIQLKFVAEADTMPITPLEIISGPTGTMYARFHLPGRPAQPQRLNVGQAVDTPWGGIKLGLLERFDHARMEAVVAEVDPARETRVPALLLALSSGEQTSEMWVQKQQPRAVSINGQPCHLVYGAKSVPLGFSVKLDKFTVGNYPGTQRPRSFTSNVTIHDPESGSEQQLTISMNHPAQYGGFTFFQTSYRMDGGRTFSYLSVARDPGQRIVFAGYILMIAGMIVVLITRARERKSQVLTHLSSDGMSIGMRNHKGKTARLGAADGLKKGPDELRSFGASSKVSPPS